MQIKSISGGGESWGEGSEEGVDIYDFQCAQSPYDTQEDRDKHQEESRNNSQNLARSKEECRSHSHSQDSSEGGSMGGRSGGEGASVLGGDFIYWDDNDVHSWEQAVQTEKKVSASNVLHQRKTFPKGFDNVLSNKNNNNNNRKADDRILTNAFRDGDHNSCNSGISRSRSNGGISRSRSDENNIDDSNSKTMLKDDCVVRGSKVILKGERSSFNKLELTEKALNNSKNQPNKTPAIIENRNLKRVNSVPTIAVRKPSVTCITPILESCRPIVKVYRCGGNSNDNNTENSNPSVVTAISRSRLKIQGSSQDSTNSVQCSVLGFHKKDGIRDGVYGKDVEFRGTDILFDERKIGYAADDSKWQYARSRNGTSSSQPSPDSTACDSISQSSLHSQSQPLSRSHSQPLASNGDEERGWRKKRKIMYPLPLFSSSKATSASGAQSLSADKTSSPLPPSPATPINHVHGAQRNREIFMSQNDQSSQGSEGSGERKDSENNWRSKRKLRRTCSSPLPSSTSSSL